jgi:hypothetical protein|tara:strand:- start:9401 stop:9577 length:177 start_codon:yes stop_codon:yes gene_type:complete
MSIFKPVGRVRVRPKRYGITVCQVRCEGTVKEWLEDIAGFTVCSCAIAALYVVMAVIV